jgi:RNA polymerase sigma-70 factor (ECF subfamily)
LRPEQNPRADAELVAATLAGDREAFATLYDRHARGVRAVVLAVSGDWSSVEDVTQECFLRAYRKLATLRDRDRFRPWLAGIARQVARERRRSLARSRQTLNETSHRLVTETNDPGSEVLEREQWDSTMQELSALPEQERLAIHAYYLQSHDAQRSAELLGLSRSGFYAVLKRAITRLSTRLRPLAHKENR